MTRGHRRQHLIVWMVLAPVILGVILGAIALRLEGAAALAAGGPR
ncbi:MAG TPA: hypothetical protein PL072_07380 [Phycisphaerales bacterium]|nr:hypothetical protein [Phycisphaerales bacterium]